MSSRKRRSSTRLKQEDDSQVLEVDLAEEAPEEQPRVKRERKSSGRSTPASTAAAAAAAAGGDADDGGTPAGGGARANGAPPRDRQQRTQFNEAEAASMMDKIKQLEDEGELAQDKAASLDLTAALDTAVSRVVRFLLFKHHEKPGVPVKRQEISDVITSSVGKSNKALKKLPALVFALAAAKLAKAFGLELRELRRHTPGSGNPAAAAAAAAGSSAAAAAGGGGAAAAAAAAAAGTHSYKLLSMLPVDLLARYNLVESDNQERGFITLVLALLQMKQYKMDEDELWRHLGQVGLERDDQDAAMPFGKHPTKILEAMEHSRYLVKSRQAAPNTERGVVTQYEWGEAAHSEFGDNVLEGVVTQFLAGDQAIGS